MVDVPERVAHPNERLRYTDGHYSVPSAKTLVLLLAMPHNDTIFHLTLHLLSHKVHLYVLIIFSLLSLLCERENDSIRAIRKGCIMHSLPIG